MRITLELIRRNSSQRIRRDEPLEKFVGRLTHVRLEEKGLQKIENLELCTKTQVLYLYGNEFTKIEGLGTLQCLTHAYLQANPFSKMENLGALANLQKLFLSDCQISVIEGLEGCAALEELHVSGQRLAPGQPLQFEERSLLAVRDSLKVLDASKCNLEHLAPLSVLVALEQCILKDNFIQDFREVAYLFRGGDADCMLWQLDMRGCPIGRVRRYRDRIVLGAPSLMELDGKDVTPTERKFLENFYAQRQRAVGAVAPPADDIIPQELPISAGIEGTTLLEGSGDPEAVVERTGPHIDAIPHKRSAESASRPERDEFVPHPGRDTEAEKERLATRMQLEGMEPEQVVVKAAAPPAAEVDEFDRVVGEIQERKQFLEEMDAMGKGKEYEAVIKGQISEKVRELEAIDKSRLIEAGFVSG